MANKRWKIGVFLGNVHFVHPRLMLSAIEEYFKDKPVDEIEKTDDVLLATLRRWDDAAKQSGESEAD